MVGNLTNSNLKNNAKYLAICKNDSNWISTSACYKMRQNIQQFENNAKY